jgi:cell division septum initiation protein DivIVA
MNDKTSALNWTKEIIAALLSLAIATLTIWMLASAYVSGSRSFFDKDAATMQANRDAYERQKDLLLYGLSLLGTVIGYYLGRVPAELSASHARQDAEGAKAQVKTTNDQLNEAVKSTMNISKDLSIAETARGRAESKIGQVIPAIQKLRSEAAKKMKTHEDAKLGGAPAKPSELNEFYDELGNLESLLKS